MAFKVTSKESDMRGLFFIVKGKYSKKAPCVTGGDDTEYYVGGYDPEGDDTVEWYRVMDNTVFFTISCGSSYEKALESIRTYIKKFKTRKAYFKMVSSITSEDYYDVHYLGKNPLSPDQVAKKAEGRCPRTSYATKMMDRCIYECYGDYYSEDIEMVEEEVYLELKDSTPRKLAQKKLGKVKTPSVKVEKKETPTPLETPKTPLKRIGVQKIRKLHI